MLDEKKSMEMLEGFQSHYSYDTSYMKEMLSVAPSAYEKFEAFLPMASHIEATPKEVLYVCKITSMQYEDCSACLQLNVDMAIEAGVEKEIIKEVLFNKGKNLSSSLKDVYEFSLAVAKNSPISEELYDKMHTKYSKEILMEMALAIASTKVFPAIKRVLKDDVSCSLIDIKVK